MGLATKKKGLARTKAKFVNIAPVRVNEELAMAITAASDEQSRSEQSWRRLAYCEKLRRQGFAVDPSWMRLKRGNT